MALTRYTEMPYIRLTFGRWYLVVTCTKCETMVPVFHDLCQGESLAQGHYFLTCPKCKEAGIYRVERYQHRERRKPEIFIDIC
jgi:hypothetical protein